MPGAKAGAVRATVLVIDPDKEHVELVRRHLAEQGYDAIATPNGAEGLEIALRHKPDLVLLEVKTHGLDGLEVCRRLRSAAQGHRIPIIILSALGTELDRVVGLEVGADDYLTKPIGPRELLARVKAMLRRASGGPEPSKVRRSGDLLLDWDRRQVEFRGVTIPLTAAEFRILGCLMARPGRVFSRSEILEAIHGDEVAAQERSVDVHVGFMRSKLGSGADMIETVRGFGYRLREGARLRAIEESRPARLHRPSGSARSRKHVSLKLTAARMGY